MGLLGMPHSLAWFDWKNDWYTSFEAEGAAVDVFFADIDWCIYLDENNDIFY